MEDFDDDFEIEEIDLEYLPQHLETSGEGLYSKKAEKIKLESAVVFIRREGGDFFSASLQITISEESTLSGHEIYTDPLFVSQLNQYFSSLGFPEDSVYYSEAGLQDERVVDMDVEEDFVNVLEAKTSMHKDKQDPKKKEEPMP